MSESVRVRDCTCPGNPHEAEGDIVYVAPTLSLQGGLAAERANSEALTETLVAAGTPPKGGWTEEDTTRLAIDMAERVRQKLLIAYVKYGATGWNLLDADGDPVKFDVEAILADYSIAYPVADKLDALYSEAVTRPLLMRRAQRSQSGRTPRKTSRTPASTKKPRESSSRQNGQADSKQLTA